MVSRKPPPGRVPSRPSSALVAVTIGCRWSSATEGLQHNLQLAAVPAVSSSSSCAIGVRLPSSDWSVRWNAVDVETYVRRRTLRLTELLIRCVNNSMTTKIGNTERLSCRNIILCANGRRRRRRTRKTNDRVMRRQLQEFLE